MMSRKLPVSLLLLTCGLAALPACGGDDGGGSGDATATGTDPDTSTGTQGMTSSVTMDDSASLTDPDTTMDPSETTDPTEDTVDPDTSTGEPGGGAAFRLNSIAIRDPHFFAPIVGDVTEAQVNTPLNAALNMDGDDSSPADGFYDIGFVLVFDPLDQAEGGNGSMTFANAQCAAGGADPVACNLLPATVEYPSTYTSQADGTCQEANPANLPPNYDPAPGVTTGPCFVSGAAAVTIATSTFSLPLENATVAAQYVGDPAGNLVSGTLIGWVSNEAADAAILSDSVPIFGGMPVSALLPDEARDDGDTGWWFHVDFTAVSATWAG